MKKIKSYDQFPKEVKQLSKKLGNIEKLLLEKQEQPTFEISEQPLPVQEAVKFLNLTGPKIYSKVIKSELPVLKRGKRHYFSSILLMKYIKDKAKKSNIESEAFLSFINSGQNINIYIIQNSNKIKKKQSTNKTLIPQYIRNFVGIGTKKIMSLLNHLYSNKKLVFLIFKCIEKSLAIFREISE